MWRELSGATAEPPADSELVLAAFEGCMALGSSPDNAKENSGKIRALLEYAAGEGLQVAEITADTVEAFFSVLREAGRASNTLYNYFTAVKNFSAWASHPRRRIVAGGLLEGIPRPKQSRPHLRYLTKHQAAVALRTIHRHAPKIEKHFILALWTGARRAEIPTIGWPDFFKDPDGRLWLRIRNFKTQSERAVPVARRLAMHLARWGMGRRGMKTGPVATPARATDTLAHDLMALVEAHADGMPVFGDLRTSATGNGWHLLRHTFASWAAMAGVDIRVIKEWMGHKSIQTTMRYAAVKPNTSAELIDRL